MNIRTQNLFRTYQEMTAVYRQLYTDNTANDPYLIKATLNNQTMTFFGCRHSNDVDDGQNEAIEKEWRLFMKNKNNHKIAFCEGGLRPLEVDRSSAIKKYSEPGLLKWLAQRDNITIISPEPNNTMEIDYLLSQKFKIEEIMTYYFGRQMYQWFMRDYKNNPNWQYYAESRISSYAKVDSLYGSNLTLQNVLKMYQSVVGTSFKETDEKRLHEISAPTSNAVAAASGLYRDISLYFAIEEAWKNGSDIFSLYGSGHAIILEKALLLLAK